MKINKILLYNFNSFEGLNELDFSNTTQEKNIVLIGGKNGAGKTSLFTAIKIALYGPLAFGYVGINPYYIAKIKDCINSKAFQKNKVESKVQITISLMVERDVKEYEITREWDYSRQKLIEKYFIKSDEKLLNDDELSYFQNYLQSIVPPDLFEFFLFDGEEVGSVFSTSTYNTYVKNAVYTLCGLDTFEIIRKYTRSYIGKAVSEDEERFHEEYENLKESVEEQELFEKDLEEQIKRNKEELERTEIDLLDLETAFKKAGGITEKEKKKLAKEYEEAEHVKAEYTVKLKLFVEGLMPFYILKDFAKRVEVQLEREEQSRLFNYIQERLDREEIRHSFAGDNITEVNIDAFIGRFLEQFKPEDFVEEGQLFHDLSREDTARVHAMITAIGDFDSQAMVETVYKKQRASERTSEINKILRNAMADEDVAGFAERENRLLKKKEALIRKLAESQGQLKELEEKITAETQQRDRMLQRLRESVQNKHVLELSTGLSQMLGRFLTDKTEDVRRTLEILIVENLQHIYRKNNLITHIEVDEDFEFNLYQDAVYSVTELAYLIRNLGGEAFSLEIGKEGKRLLYERYGVDSLRQLQRILAEADGREKIDLYKKIDISRLSKGERQIFILSLYWGIIKLSGQDIPFIIDTPYARIDANHRREISEKFFPSISRQVIILSTDEEVNEEYYQIMKPYIAKEFLLVNDENKNRTSVEQHYFF